MILVRPQAFIAVLWGGRKQQSKACNSQLVASRQQGFLHPLPTHLEGHRGWVAGILSYILDIGNQQLGHLESASKLPIESPHQHPYKIFTPITLHCSQPPLLSEMVRAIFNTTGEISFLAEHFPALELEYAYWTREPVQVTLHTGGQSYKLARYYSTLHSPRPESYRCSLLLTLLEVRRI